MSVTRIVPNLTSENPSETANFYKQVLDLDVVMDQGWIVTLSAAGGAKTQLSLLSGDATAPVVAAASIEVDDVDSAYQAAAGSGAEIVHPLTDEPWGVRRFLVRDTDGNVINVLSHNSK